MVTASDLNPNYASLTSKITFLNQLYQHSVGWPAFAADQYGYAGPASKPA